MSNDSHEEWRPVPGWDDLYEVSSLGRVRSLHRAGGRILRPAADPNGYMRIGLHRNPAAGASARTPGVQTQNKQVLTIDR